MPKISVLIPVYNSEKYLEKCLESVVNQSFEDIEIIIINDGSFDSSIDIINKFSSDKRIKVINKKNTGYGASLNIGIKEARGKYIAIVESDDFIDKDMLKSLYQNQDCDIVKSGFYYHPQNTQYNLFLNGVYTIDDIPEAINLKPSIWSAIYKKDFLLSNNMFFNESKGASYQDVSFHLKTFFLANKIKFINTPYYHYRTDNMSSSVKVKNQPQAIIKEFKIIDNFLSDKVILPETKAQIQLFRLRAFMWNFKRISKIYEDEFMQSSNKNLKLSDMKFFYGSKNIKLKDKIKMFLYINYPEIFKLLLIIIKKYFNQRGLQ